MTIALIIPHGGAVRNFLYSGVLTSLRERATIVVVSPLIDAVQRHLPSAEHTAIEWYCPPPFVEAPVDYLLRRSSLLAHMRLGDTLGMRHMLRKYRPHGPWRTKRLADEIAWLYSHVITSHDHVARQTRRYMRSQRRHQPYHDYRALFAKHDVNLVLCCDHRPPEMTPIVAAARDLMIPAGTFIFSWDNLTSKGRMPCDYDFYCVWSQLMKRDLKRFYPHIDDRAIHVTGTPQFAMHFNPEYRLTRDEFCTQIGADSTRPLICFSGEDAITDPENPLHLQAVCSIVEKWGSSPSPQIVVRPCPVDTAERWSSVRERHPDIVWAPPVWESSSTGAWQLIAPTIEDDRMLANMVYHCECCVNMNSTMTIDFAIGDKPTVNTAFDITAPPPHGIPTWEHQFQWDHYRSVVDLEAAHIARNQPQLAEQLRVALEHPNRLQNGRQQLVSLQTDDILADAPTKVSETLVELAAR